MILMVGCSLYITDVTFSERNKVIIMYMDGSKTKVFRLRSGFKQQHFLDLILIIGSYSKRRPTL